jgi:hypothetical protein
LLRRRCAALVVYNGEALNGLGAEHWQSFSKQPYFDGNGIFYSAVVSAPLMIIMFIILVGAVGSIRTRQAAAPCTPWVLPGRASCAGQRLAAEAGGWRGAQINYLLTAAGMLVQAKRRELMMKARQRAKLEQQAEPKKDK